MSDFNKTLSIWVGNILWAIVICMCSLWLGVIAAEECFGGEFRISQAYASTKEW